MCYLAAQMGFSLYIGHRCVLLCEVRTVEYASSYNACSAGTPTLGSRGTVVGVHEGAVEVLFDADFIGGGDLYGRCRGQCGGMLAPADLLNLAKPHFSNITGAGQKTQRIKQRNVRQQMPQVPVSPKVLSMLCVSNGKIRLVL